MPYAAPPQTYVTIFPSDDITSLNRRYAARALSFLSVWRLSSLCGQSDFLPDVTMEANGHQELNSGTIFSD